MGLRSQISTGSTSEKLSELKGLATVSGYIPQMAEATSNLLSLTFSGDRLLLDREFWKDQFGGESIMTLVNRVQDQMEKSKPSEALVEHGRQLFTCDDQA